MTKRTQQERNAPASHTQAEPCPREWEVQRVKCLQQGKAGINQLVLQKSLGGSHHMLPGKPLSARGYCYYKVTKLGTHACGADGDMYQRDTCAGKQRRFCGGRVSEFLTSSFGHAGATPRSAGGIPCAVRILAESGPAMTTLSTNLSYSYTVCAVQQ